MPRRRASPLFLVLALTAMLVPAALRGGDLGAPSATLPGISGLTWLTDDTFVAVHDAKNPGQDDRPRVSLLRLPASRDARTGVAWQPLDLHWPPPQGPSSDLESAARIPGTGYVLLAESGATSASEGPFRRIFLVDFVDDPPAIKAVAPWPVEVANVEGIAVGRAGERLLFVFAERAAKRDTPTRGTEIRWSELRLDLAAQPASFSFGPFTSAGFHAPGFQGEKVRLISELVADDSGQLYAASTLDGGDDGPFRSVVWQIGQIDVDDRGEPRVSLWPKPECLALVDGFKVEGLAARPGLGGATQVFFGTDDERFGGTLRPLPLRQAGNPACSSGS